MKIPTEVEARLLKGKTATSIYRHSMMQDRAKAAETKLHGRQCVHEQWEGDSRVRCNNSAIEDMSHGWLCHDHYTEQGKVIRGRS